MRLVTSRIHHGFVIQATSRIEGSSLVLYYFGRLTDGRSFQIRETRQRPHFYVRTQDLHAEILSRKQFEWEFTNSISIDGEDLRKLVFKSPSELQSIRAELGLSAVPTYEADLPLTLANLMHRNIFGGIAIDGMMNSGSQTADVTFLDPSIAPAEVDFKPKILHLGIWFHPNSKLPEAISLCGLGQNELLIIPSCLQIDHDSATVCSGQAELLSLFVDRVTELDPDVITGRNSCQDLQMMVQLTRSPRQGLDSAYRETQTYCRRNAFQGKLVVDALPLLRRVGLENFNARGHTHRNYTPENFRDRNSLNRTQLILALHNENRLLAHRFKTLKVGRLLAQRSQLRGVLMDRDDGNGRAFDPVYISVLNHNNMRAPSRSTKPQHKRPIYHYGLRSTREPGMYRNVLNFEFPLFYTRIIQTFNIDPLSFNDPNNGMQSIPERPGDQLQRGVLPAWIDSMTEQLNHLSRKSDLDAQRSLSRELELVYKTLASPYFRFYNRKLIKAITSRGRRILKFAITWFEDYGYPVLHANKDRLFVCSNLDSITYLDSLAAELEFEFANDLRSYIERGWSVNNTVSLVFQSAYSHFEIPTRCANCRTAISCYGGLVITKFHPVRVVVRNRSQCQANFDTSTVTKIMMTQSTS